MKINMIGPVYPYRGGIAHYTTWMARALKAAGHRLQVVIFKRQYPAFLYPGPSDKDPSANPARVNARYLLDLLHPWTWYRAARRIFEAALDLILIHWWATIWGPACADLALQLGKRILAVYLIHSVLLYEAHPWDYWLAKFGSGSGGQAFIIAPAAGLLNRLCLSRYKFLYKLKKSPYDARREQDRHHAQTHRVDSMLLRAAPGRGLSRLVCQVIR